MTNHESRNGSDADPRLAEEALRQSEELLNEVGHIAQIGGWEMDLVTRAAKWTRVTYEIVGLALDSPVPGPDEHLQYYVEEDRPIVAEAMRALIEDDIPLEFEARAKLAGDVRWFRALGRAVRDQGRCVRVLGTLQDITDRKRQEEENARLETQLRHAQKLESVGRLAGGVAHDFNNMLSVILGHVEMAIEQLEPAHPVQADLEEIKTAAERSANLTRQLLAFARKQTVAPRVLDLNMTVESMLNMLRRLIGEDIDLAWHPCPDLWAVKMDPSQLDQILANLCVNSRDAISGVGKMTIEMSNCSFDEDWRSEHPDFAPGDYVRLSVSDNGSGMDSATLQNLFEPFFTTKGLGQGTGLGLATVYGIVKQNNGFIKVYSERNHGTTFAIYLPRHAARTPEAASERPPALVLGGNETILLVEDEAAILGITRRQLESMGYTVLAAGTPGQAIRLATEYSGEIHLLMTDVVMPEMNGRDLTRILLERHPRLKCLFMSGYTANVIAHHGVLEEGVHFIQKPFSRQDLTAKIFDALKGD
ncbi:MAG: response regulator [Deltaproteobacteria bacterium]|nr:response regulator [Deltaproteobacteria bacterium]